LYATKCRAEQKKLVPQNGAPQQLLVLHFEALFANYKSVIDIGELYRIETVRALFAQPNILPNGPNDF